MDDVILREVVDGRPTVDGGGRRFYRVEGEDFKVKIGT